MVYDQVSAERTQIQASDPPPHTHTHIRLVLFQACSGDRQKSIAGTEKQSDDMYRFF